ncbi:hypothetical protein EDB83DRAFT_2373881 [Lactarius deliciosus]|nr:hypothetical protein EDB83DRAFT_2373881 [Lactarius deliciosus]
MVSERFVHKCLAPALPSHPCPSSALRRLDDAIHNACSALALAPDGSTKSLSLVFSQNRPTTSSPSSLSATRGLYAAVVTEPMNRRARVVSELSRTLLLPPPPNMDGPVDCPVTSVLADARVCTGTRTTNNVPGTPVDRSFAGGIRALARARVSTAHIQARVVVGYHKAKPSMGPSRWLSAPAVRRNGGMSTTTTRSRSAGPSPASIEKSRSKWRFRFVSCRSGSDAVGELVATQGPLSVAGVGSAAGKVEVERRPCVPTAAPS